jgi:antitoxin (DNA-binding transcriptional repressor) of toxin-antitoxin stability system
MITAGIKDAKNNLSHYLALVKTGEEIVITERGKPVARIVRERNGKQHLRTALNPLIRRGLIVLPTRDLIKDRLSPLSTHGKPVSEMVIEDRR